MYEKLNAASHHHAVKKLGYAQQWIFDLPLLISHEKFDETNTLHGIFYKLITCFVNNYPQYEYLLPIAEKTSKILAFWHERPYSPGTFRTDFVLDDMGAFRPIEITCRFALNGFFTNKIMEIRSKNTLFDVEENDVQNPYDDFLRYFYKKIEKKGRILLLKDTEDRNESEHFLPIFDQVMIPVVIRNISEINENHDDLDDFFIINELNFDELHSLSLETHKALAKSGVLNDFRTIFLIHDKQFFSAICSPELQQHALNEEELSFFKSVVIPTYNYHQATDIWFDARKNKANWVLKHRVLGKSESVFAGLVTEQQEWEDLFKRQDIDEFILQQWINQKTIKGTINGQPYNDYLTGTLLFFNQHNFGFAVFRTSSFPVTNKVDDRKYAGVILKDGKTEAYQNLNNIKVF